MSYIKTSLIAYQGPSLIDGKPIAVILTSNSKNGKTGDMVQSIIIRTDIEPHIAIKSGDDYSVCGDCIHRPTNNNSCYVLVHNAPLSVYRAMKRGRYLIGNDTSLANLLEGKKLRIGTYGDPAAVPTDVWNRLTSYAEGFTGYTHQWRHCDPILLNFCMASCDTPQDQVDARTKGYRTFRVRLESEALHAGEFVCPASAEGNHRLNCDTCKSCDGVARGSKKGSPAIIVHGCKSSRYVTFRERLAA